MHRKAITAQLSKGDTITDIAEQEKGIAVGQKAFLTRRESFTCLRPPGCRTMDRERPFWDTDAACCH